MYSLMVDAIAAGVWGAGLIYSVKGYMSFCGKGARWPVVSFCYCTDLTHQSEIKALTVANIKGLLLACPVPRGFFLLSILIYCRSQGGSSLIMKGRVDAPEPHQAQFQSIFILKYTVIKDSAVVDHWHDWSGVTHLFLNQPGIYSCRILWK